MSKLTPNEKCLSFIAFVVVTASIGLALCIGFVLPLHWSSKAYVSYKYERSPENCQCDRRKITTNYINCVPRSFSDRVLQPLNNTHNKSEEECKLGEEYPYAVSLNIPTYNDNDKERSLACTGTILSRKWVLIGQDCVFNESEFAMVKLRAGSTYWSKGGKEYNLDAISTFSDKGPTAITVSKPLEFGKYVGPVRLSTTGKYTTWLSAVSVGWTKERVKKYEKLSIQKWTTTPCTDQCYKGEVLGNPTCGEPMFNRALVAENRLLVGIQTGICRTNNTSTIMYADVQTDEYQSWFKFLLDENADPTLEPSLRSLERELVGTTASPITIYQSGQCLVSDSSNLHTTVSTYSNTSSILNSQTLSTREGFKENVTVEGMLLTTKSTTVDN